ncbi:MAG: outer membrane beta-barrel protein [Acidobacteriota bacterium]
MRTRPVSLRTSALVFLALALPPAHVQAQQPRLPRADGSMSVGWLHSNVSDMDHPYDSWASRRATLNGQAGFYWTEHWKVELGAERSTTQDRWQSSPVELSGGSVAYRVSEQHIQDTRLSIGQFYQFGHNAWAHLLLGGGLTVTLRHTVSDVQPLTRYDRNAVVVVEPGYSNSTDDTSVNPFAALAVKTYLTPRVFMRSDVQTDFRSNLQAVVLRIGFGVDF